MMFPKGLRMASSIGKRSIVANKLITLLKILRVEREAEPEEVAS